MRWQMIVIYLKLSIAMEYIMFKIKQCNNKKDEDHNIIAVNI